MKIRQYVVTAALALVVLGATVTGVWAQTEQEKSGTAADEKPLSRDQILKEGPAALENNCVGCHLADKWEGTNRDRDGWSAIVTEMSKLMDDAGKPKMSDKTFNLVVDYLALTRPQ